MDLIKSGKSCHAFPDSEVRGANMGPTWGRQDPCGPLVGPMELCYLGCWLFGANPLPEARATYCQLNHHEVAVVWLGSKFNRENHWEYGICYFCFQCHPGNQELTNTQGPQCLVSSRGVQGCFCCSISPGLDIASWVIFGAKLSNLMMTSSNENIFHVTGHLCGEFTGLRWHKGQWRGALMFTLICVWINGWVNNREAGDLRCYRTPYDVIVMCNANGAWPLAAIAGTTGYPGTLPCSQSPDKIYRYPIFNWVAVTPLNDGVPGVFPVMTDRVTCPIVEYHLLIFLWTFWYFVLDIITHCYINPSSPGAPFTNSEYHG